MIVEGTSSYITYSPNQVPPSIESREQDAFAWWKLTQDGQYRIVERLSGECQLREGTTGIYDYTYTWLVEDITDDDNDGLLDYFEINGMLLSNGTLASSSTTTEDSDVDGISDCEEVGIRYRMSRDEDGKITISVNGEIVLSDVYYIEASSPYFFLADQIPPAGITYRSIWVPLSDPNNPDTDEDGAFDFEDATPRRANGAISYIIMTFSDDERVSELEAPYRKALETRGYDYECVTIITVGGENGFRSFWGNMNRLNHDPNGKIAYSEVQELIIIGHGLPTQIQFGTNAATGCLDIYHLQSEPSSPDYLEPPPCVIQNLDLQACLCACENENGTCLAYEFLEYSNRIINVYGWSGSVTYYFGCHSSYFNFDTSTNLMWSASYLCIFRNANGEMQTDSLGCVVGILERRET